MSKYRSVWISLLFALTCSASQAQSIKVVTENTSYSYQQDGRVVGPASEVVDATLRRAGLSEFRIAVYPWARAYDIALQEPNVLIYLIARTPEREALFKWVGELTRIDYHFYKLRERSDIVIRDLHAAKRYTMGVLRDDVRHQYLEAQGFTRLVVSAQNMDNFRKLLNRQVELVPMPERDAVRLAEEVGVEFATLEQVFKLDALGSGLYMAYSRSTDDAVVARTRAAFDSLKAEGVVEKLMAEGR